VITVFGPLLPPEIQWRRLFDSMLPAILSKNLPLPLQLSPFGLLKRSWSGAFEIESHCQLSGPKFHVEPVVRKLVSVQRRSVARTLSLEDADTNTDPPVFAGTSETVCKKRTSRGKKQLVQSENRRFTRSCLKQDGMRPKPVLDAPVRAKKRPRAKLLLIQQVEAEATRQNAPEKNDGNEKCQIPATPIHVMQRVGKKLGIDPQKLSKEQLEADPNAATSDGEDDE
jgi:hypothetical protein